MKLYQLSFPLLAGYGGLIRWISRVESSLACLPPLVDQTAELRNQTARLEKRVSSIESSLSFLQPFVEYTESNFGIILGEMRTRELLSEEKSKRITMGMSFSKIFQRLSRGKTENPITAEELEKLKGYVTRVQGGDFLSMDEALEFQRLSRLLAEEKKDEGTWWLLMLAAFLVGWWIGASKE